MPDSIIYKASADKTTQTIGAEEDAGVAVICSVPYVPEGYTKASVDFLCSNSSASIKRVFIQKNGNFIYDGTNINISPFTISKGDSIQAYFWTAVPYTGTNTLVSVDIMISKN